MLPRQGRIGFQGARLGVLEDYSIPMGGGFLVPSPLEPPSLGTCEAPEPAQTADDAAEADDSAGL